MTSQLSDEWKNSVILNLGFETELCYFSTEETNICSESLQQCFVCINLAVVLYVHNKWINSIVDVNGSSKFAKDVSNTVAESLVIYETKNFE